MSVSVCLLNKSLHDLLERNKFGLHWLVLPWHLHLNKCMHRLSCITDELTINSTFKCSALNDCKFRVEIGSITPTNLIECMHDNIIRKRL